METCPAASHGAFDQISNHSAFWQPSTCFGSNSAVETHHYRVRFTPNERTFVREVLESESCHEPTSAKHTLAKRLFASVRWGSILLVRSRS